MRSLNLLVVFLLELAALVGLGLWAWSTAPDGWRWPAALALPAVVAVLWGVFLSPRARVRLPRTLTVGARSAVLVAGGLGLGIAGHPVAGVVVLVLVAVTSVLALVWRQDEALGRTA